MSCKNCTCDKDKCQIIVPVNGISKKCDCETCVCKFKKDAQVNLSNTEDTES